MASFFEDWLYCSMNKGPAHLGKTLVTILLVAVIILGLAGWKAVELLYLLGKWLFS